MHKQHYLCCKNNCCKQDTKWIHFGGFNNNTKDSRNRTCTNGPSKGFVQNLKDKLVNLQNESLQLQFPKKPVKKKQKDYYCLMLRKINSLDKKLQNLEHLFISHLNHTPNEVFTSNDNEPIYDYMDFYESVRSLVDLANRIKEDILCKQCDNHVPSRNTLHLNDRIKVLDSELQNLYSYLEQLQNCTNETVEDNQCYVQDCQDLPCTYSIFRGGPKVENKRCNDFKEFRKTNKNNRKTPKNYNADCKNNSSCQYIECCYEADEDSAISCQCSRCNLSAPICSMNPRNRRYSPNVYECCKVTSIAKNSECFCVLCVNERKKENQFKRNDLWVSESASSSSCELCPSSNRKLSRQNCNSARIKIIKPVKKRDDEAEFVGELQISYHEMEPSKNDKIKKQNNKRKNQNINEYEHDEETNLETKYFQDIGVGTNSMTTSHNKSQNSSILEQTQDKFSKNQHSKTFSPLNKKEIEEKNVIYYELSPDLNIITKRRNNGRFFNRGQEFYQETNKNDKKAKNKAAKKRDVSKINGPNKMHTVNFNLREGDSSKRNFNKIARDKRNPRNYRGKDYSSSDSEQMGNSYQVNKNKNNPVEPKNRNNKNGSAGKHLHIKIRNTKDFNNGMTMEENIIKSPKHQYKYTDQHSQLYHRKHGGFCHFQNENYDKNRCCNKKMCSSFQPLNCEISESDGFETLEEYESDGGSCSSQYKVFFCSDPNCVDKLDSEELIMLMNKPDLKYCGGNPCKLNINENVKDLKSDNCEKCLVKEKEISVTPLKTKNKNNDGTAKIIFKKETVECSKCKNNEKDKISEKKIKRTNVDNNDSETDNDESCKRETTNKTSNMRKKVRNKKNYLCESGSCSRTDFKNHKSRPNNFLVEGQNKKNYLCESGSCSRTDFKNHKSRPSHFLVESVYHSHADSTKNANNNEKLTSTIDGSSGKKTTTATCSKLDQSTSFSKTVKENNSNSTGTGTKVLELPGFGNLININIERGSYSVNKQTDTNNAKQNIEEENLPEITYLSNNNINPSLLTNTMNHDKVIAVGYVHSSKVGLHNAPDCTSKDLSNQLNQSTLYAKNKSVSVMDLVKTNEKETKDVTITKSESFTEKDNVNSRIKVKDDIVGLNQSNGEKIILHSETVSSEVVREKEEKRPRSNKKHMNMNKEITLNYIAEGSSGHALPNTKSSHYIYEKRYDQSTNPLVASKKSIEKPRLSISKVRRSRLKYNKKFGSSLSKVSSAQSIVVQSAANFPSHKINFFSPGRRNSKLSKRRPNAYPRTFPLKENSLSGIVKPQVQIVVQESYRNDFKIPSNNCSNARYKVASISNYLSSTVTSESSYSTLNWEKVANKLKEDDTFFNNIA